MCVLLLSFRFYRENGCYSGTITWMDVLQTTCQTIQRWKQHCNSFYAYIRCHDLMISIVLNTFWIYCVILRYANDLQISIEYSPNHINQCLTFCWITRPYTAWRQHLSQDLSPLEPVSHKIRNNLPNFSAEIHTKCYIILSALSIFQDMARLLLIKFMFLLQVFLL